MAQQVPFPQTIARLAQSCEIYATRGGNADVTAQLAAYLGSNDLTATGSSVDLVTNVLAAALEASVATKIGAITSMTAEQNRTLTRIYSLGSYSFEPQRLVPGRITTRLRLNRVVLNELNNEDVLAAFGFAGWNLFYQQTPVIIKQVFYDPFTDTPVESNLFLDCWLADNGNVAFDVMSNNMLLIQKCTMECGRVINSEAVISSSLVSSSSLSKAIKFG